MQLTVLKKKFMGMGSGFFDQVGKIPSFSGGPNDDSDESNKGEKNGKAAVKFKDPSLILKGCPASLYTTHSEEEWFGFGMLDGFNKPEQEKLATLYNEIIGNDYLWIPEYKELYLIAANYAMRALHVCEELPPSTRERLIAELDAERFINDMNKVLTGLTESMKKFFPNTNSEFGIMCLFSHTYVGEIVAGEITLEQIKAEIYKTK